MGGAKILRALISKRLELLTALERHESAASALHDDLVHVDATILLFIEGTSWKLFQALRLASKPMSTEWLATLAKINPKRAALVLRCMCASGLVRQSAGQPALWTAAY